MSNHSLEVVLVGYDENLFASPDGLAWNSAVASPWLSASTIHPKLFWMHCAPRGFRRVNSIKS